MNVFIPCMPYTLETGPPFTAFTPYEASLCEKFFDFPHLLEQALLGDEKTADSLGQELTLLAKDAEKDHEARFLLCMLARYGLPEAKRLAQNL